MLLPANAGPVRTGRVHRKGHASFCGCQHSYSCGFKRAPANTWNPPGPCVVYCQASEQPIPDTLPVNSGVGPTGSLPEQGRQAKNGAKAPRSSLLPSLDGPNSAEATAAEGSTGNGAGVRDGQATELADRDDDDDDDAGDGEVSSVEEAVTELLCSDTLPSFQDVCDVFPFPLDDFQAEAVQKSMRGVSVLVSAPTGAGKTAIAVAAAIPVLARGQRVIYTTPLKALSNQKLYELQAVFGEHRVGLRTGDLVVNPTADIIVMTTEILRNMSYRMLLTDQTHVESGDSLEDISLAVLDEVHYLGHQDRGSVWEEIIINLPPNVRLLGMSATVANPDEIGAWISSVHSKCELVQTTHRPVPLQWWFAWGEETRQRGSTRTRMQYLLEKGLAVKGKSELRPNPDLRPKVSRAAQDKLATRLDGLKAQMQREKRRNIQKLISADIMHLKQSLQQLLAGHAGGMEPNVTHLLQKLKARKALPAIYFVFSRRRCNTYAQSLTTSLVTVPERDVIRGRLQRLQESQPEAVPADLIDPLLCGVASHHAGLLPGWKALVEGLFRDGYIKVVFATETLAAGINMPARTTIVSSMSRRRDGIHVSLLHNELLQMAGRAGRRGYDTEGHCVLTQTRHEGVSHALNILSQGPEDIRSQFTISYGMVLNLLSTRSLEECKAFLDRSFLRFQEMAGAADTMQHVRELEERAAKLEEAAAAEAEQDVGTALEELQQLRVERRKVRATAHLACSEHAAMVLEAPGHYTGSPAGHKPEAPPPDSDFLLPSRVHEAEAGTTPASGAPPDADVDSHEWQEWMRGVTEDAATKAAASVRERNVDHPDACSVHVVRIHTGRKVWAKDIPRPPWGTDVVWAFCFGRVSDLLVSGVLSRQALEVAELQLEDRGVGQAELYCCVAEDSSIHLVTLQRIVYIQPQHAATSAAIAPAAEEAIATLRDLFRHSQLWVVVPEQQPPYLMMQMPLKAKLRKLRKAFQELELGESLLESLDWQAKLVNLETLVREQRARVKRLSLAEKAKSRRGLRKPMRPSGAAALRVQARQLRAQLRQDRSTDWQDVVNIVAVLNNYGALKPVLETQTGRGEAAEGGRRKRGRAGAGAEAAGRFSLQTLGRVARDIRFENELLLALVLEHVGQRVERISPSTLAGLMCALVSPYQLSRPDVEISVEPSSALQAVLADVEFLSHHLGMQQAQHSVVSPIQLDARMSGVVESWVWNTPWLALKAQCALDDGDIARLLSRTADLLRQITAAPAVDERVRNIAKLAFTRVYRSPICDLLGA